MKSPFKSPPAERTVRLRSLGFESSVVRSPMWGEDDSLAWFFQHPARVNPSAFVTALLAACLVPARRPAEVAALPAPDRARLRRAVIAVCGREREWRGLHGSHLSGDERLMAVMVWRWFEHELAFARLRERLRERQRELFEAAETLRGKSVVPAETALGVASVFQQAMRSMTVYDKLLNPFPNYAKLLNPFPDYAKSLRLFADHSALVPKLPDYSALAPRLPDYSKVALGFPDRSLMNATRLARSLYADPSPMVLSRVGGGVNNPLWSKSVQTVLGLGEPAWLQTVKGMTTDVALHRGIVAQVNVGLAGPLGVSSLLRMPALPFVDIGKTLRDFIDPLREARELFEEIGRFMSRWEQQALWFLLAHLGLRAWRWLANLGRAEVEEVVLHALEVVVTYGEVVPALRAAVGKAPYLSPFQRTLLDNMLEQAAEGAYIKASGSMYPGLEGAFTEIGCARTVITPERRWTDPPHKPVSFDTMVKRLKLQHEGFELFVVTAVFGKAGDEYRHGYGDATTGVRRQVLFGIAALAGWLQEFTSVEALDALGARLERALPTAIEHVRRRLLDAAPEGAGPWLTPRA